MGPPAGTTAGAVLSARATRSAFGRPWVIALFFLIAGTYAVASMLLGGMLVVARTGASSLTVWVITAGNPWWNYPALLVVFPGATFALPFFPTLSMIVVSIGVGIGMSVAAVIAVRLIVLRRASVGRPLAAGSIAGLTPALLALVTMGACCTTTAASAAGLGVVAQTTGTSVDTLLANNWYLGVFQMLVVGVALLAQEAILAAYGPMLGLSGAPLSGLSRDADPPPLRGRDLVATGARVVLVAAAALWSLEAFAALFSPSGSLTTPAAWFGFLVEHQLVAGVVLAVALFPRSFRESLGASVPHPSTSALRGGLLLTGLIVLTWIPPFWASSQTAGLLNELLGVAGAPASWGAVAPPFSGTIALVLRFSLGFALLGLFSLALALWPRATLDRIDPNGSRSGGVPIPSASGERERETGSGWGAANLPLSGPNLGSSPGPRSPPTRPMTSAGTVASDPGILGVETEGP
jgi:hypothetical protein